MYRVKAQQVFRSKHKRADLLTKGASVRTNTSAASLEYTMDLFGTYHQSQNTRQTGKSDDVSALPVLGFCPQSKYRCRSENNQNSIVKQQANINEQREQMYTQMHQLHCEVYNSLFGSIYCQS
jgi:hypothetical protein